MASNITNEEENLEHNKTSPVEEIFPIEIEQCSSIQEAKDICEEVLGNKMAALELNDMKGNNNAGDGSDSGVDIATNLNVGLQRALSSNSGGYASSGGGLDEPNISCNLSCDSSMISYNSDLGENKTVSTVLSQNSNYECTSENGSESSSIAGGPTIRKVSIVKKKVAMNEPISARTPRKNDSNSNNVSNGGQINKSRSRATSLNRTPSLTKPAGPNLQTRERARSREKNSTTPSSKSTTPPYRSTPVRRPPKPDTLPTSLATSPSIQRISNHQRTPSATRIRTPNTPNDDGRWPSIGAKGITMTPRRGGSAAPDLTSIKSRVNMMSLDIKASSVLDKYGTLPRRRKQKSVEDLAGRSSRSSSASRDNKMTSSVILNNKRSGIPSREQTPSKVLPPFPKPRKVVPKTKIYHETSVQTAITSQDVEKAFAGAARNISVEAAELKDKESQVDIRDKEVESLQEEVRKLINLRAELQSNLEEKIERISYLNAQLNREREEKLQAQKELHQNTERVIGMLELTRGTPTEEQAYDSLMMLESQIQMSGHELEEKQAEINKLRKICRTLQNEMERSLAAQKILMQEKALIEKESTELQDFLQNEKTAMCDALKDVETEYLTCKKSLEDKEQEVKVLREECRHLVRVNEQRRQENKALHSKYNALEARSKDLIVQQSTAVSGASMALSGLHSRLDNLVEQLISSYNISERDLEDVVFHNEAYTNSASSGEGSPEYETATTTGIGSSEQQQNDGSLSPQRNQSFIAAVISAIKNATTSSKRLAKIKKARDDLTGDESDSTEMLDSETEPCLMMDNVLEDVTMPDSHSHNMVSSSGMMISQIEIPSDMMMIQHGDESLHNLSQAIANRQQIEMQINSMAAQKNILLSKNKSELSISDDISGHDSIAEMPSISDYCSAQALVDQVIEVDNLVTKLLKVLRLIQMDNDNCIQQLIADKNKLQLNKEEMLEKLKDYEDINIKLRDEIMDATQQLMLKDNDLSNNKAEIQRHRNEIDRLNEDICNLSTLCSHSIMQQQQQQQHHHHHHHHQNEQQLKCMQIIHDNQNYEISKNLLASLQAWQKGDENIQEKEIISAIVAACKEIPVLREKLFYKEHPDERYLQLTRALHEDAVKETKRQYEAIDKTLDVLHNLQSIVEQCPSLIQLQHDLEEINFQSAMILPKFTALLPNNQITTITTITNTNSNTNTNKTNTNNVSIKNTDCCNDIVMVTYTTNIVNPIDQVNTHNDKSITTSSSSSSSSSSVVQQCTSLTEDVNANNTAGNNTSPIFGTIGICDSSAGSQKQINSPA